MSWRTQGFADRDAIARIPSWLNPLAQARQVAELLGGDFLEHGGGHVVPVEAEELAKWMKLTRAPA